MSLFKTLIRLSRTYELPTVWSNCLAGWWLGGGGQAGFSFLLVFAGATLLYLGGAFLNDAFDIEFDRRHRREKAVPAGKLSLRTVWQLGLVWLVIGAVVLLAAGTATGALGLLLVSCIIGFNMAHRVLPFAPVLLGFCRFLLYLLGASAATRGITGWAIWSGLAMVSYVAGAGYFTRREKPPGNTAGYWPILPMLVPVLLALLLNAGPYRPAALLLSGVLALWLIRCLRQIILAPPASNGARPSGLTAGMILVDWLACANGPRELSFTFIALALAVVLLEYAALLPPFKSAPPPGSAPTGRPRVSDGLF